jgi:hypothetical protein
MTNVCHKVQKATIKTQGRHMMESCMEDNSKYQQCLPPELLRFRETERRTQALQAREEAKKKTSAEVNEDIRKWID